MAYVFVAYPSVVYGPNGVPQPVATATVAATMPASYLAAPAMAAPAVVPVVDPQLALTATITEQITAGLGLVVVQPPSGTALVVADRGGPATLLL